MLETSRTRQGFLPNFCDVRVLFLVVLLAELLAIVLSLADKAPQSGLLFDLAMRSLFVQWVALASAGLLCVSRRWLDRRDPLPAALVAWGMIMLVTVVVAELSWFLAPWAWQEPAAARGGQLHFLLRATATSGIFSAVCLRYFYVNRQWHQNVEAAAQSRFYSLQARIRPHFLFNCLNSIAAMIGQRPHDAERAVEDLASLIRVSMNDGRNLIAFADELALCKQYLRIETIRLGERLRVQWQVEAVPGTAHIPQLTLQPLLENAVYHGVETLEKGCVVRIEGERVGSGYSLRVCNERALQQQSGPGAGHALAVENVQRRLFAIYGSEASLELTGSGAEYQVCLFIPRLNLRQEELRIYGLGRVPGQGEA